MEFVEKLRRPRRRRAAAEMRPQKYEGAVIFGSMLNTKARCEAAERVCVKVKTEKKSAPAACLSAPRHDAVNTLQLR
jgi:hypothetical protein